MGALNFNAFCIFRIADQKLEMFRKCAVIQSNCDVKYKRPIIVISTDYLDLFENWNRSKRSHSIGNATISIIIYLLGSSKNMRSIFMPMAQTMAQTIVMWSHLSYAIGIKTNVIETHKFQHRFNSKLAVCNLNTFKLQHKNIGSASQTQSPQDYFMLC